MQFYYLCILIDHLCILGMYSSLKCAWERYTPIAGTITVTSENTTEEKEVIHRGLEL